MALPLKEQGQTKEYYLLYEILKKLDQLVKVTAQNNPNISTTTTTTTTSPD